MNRNIYRRTVGEAKGRAFVIRVRAALFSALFLIGGALSHGDENDLARCVARALLSTPQHIILAQTSVIGEESFLPVDGNYGRDSVAAVSRTLTALRMYFFKVIETISGDLAEGAVIFVDEGDELQPFLSDKRAISGRDGSVYLLFLNSTACPVRVFSSESYIVRSNFGASPELYRLVERISEARASRTTGGDWIGAFRELGLDWLVNERTWYVVAGGGLFRTRFPRREFRKYTPGGWDQWASARQRVQSHADKTVATLALSEAEEVVGFVRQWVADHKGDAAGTYRRLQTHGTGGALGTRILHEIDRELQQQGETER